MTDFVHCYAFASWSQIDFSWIGWGLQYFGLCLLINILLAGVIPDRNMIPADENKTW